MLEPLWGLKTVAAFDVWSLEHLCSGLSYGTFVHRKNRKILSPFFRKLTKLENKVHTRYDVLGVLLIAYAWECFEIYLELGLGGSWLTYWLQGVEFWANRLIADPLLMVAGYFLVRKYPILIWPARLFSICWLFMNLVIFPNSMYLQTFLTP